MNNLQKEMVNQVLNMDQQGLLFLHGLLSQWETANRYFKTPQSDMIAEKREMATVAAKSRALWQSDENIANIILEMREERF